MTHRLDDGLDALGWHAVHAEAFAIHDDGAAWPGRVVRVDRGGWLSVAAADGDQRCRQHPRFRRVSDPLEAPTVGDWVVLRDDAGGGEPVADAVLARRTLFVRNAGDDERAQPQPLAANIDTVLILLALDAPYNARRTDRFVALAWASGAQPMVLLTKADAVEDVDAVVDDVRSQLVDVPVHAVSVRNGRGLDAITAEAGPGRTVVLIGQSGAGKSTLANRLAGEHLLEAADVRRDGKGRHTTTHRQLLRLPSGGLLIDTPGLRSVGMWEPPDALDDEAFADIDELAAGCRFSDCSHEAEPGCAVQDALQAGTLTAQRWDSYRTLRAEAAEISRSRRRAEQGRGRRRR